MGYRLPPLNALRAFESAARHGSIARAARELFVTPAAVSHQVKSLEEHLGVKLFRRLPRGLALTEAGRALAPSLGEGFERLAQAAEALDDQKLKGHLTVSCHPSFASSWLARRLGGFHRRYPDLAVHVLSRPEIEDFSNPDIDMAIRYGGGDYPGTVSHLLLEESVFPVCSPSLLNGRHTPETLAEIRDHTLLHDHDANIDEPSLTWKPWLKMAGLPAFHLSKGLFFSDPIALFQAAIAGQGIAIGRSALLAEHLMNGRLIRPFQDTMPAKWSYYAVMPEDRAQDGKVAAFINWIGEES